MAETARGVKTPDCECIGESDTVLDAAQRLAELDVGACRSAATTTPRGCSATATSW